MKKFLLIIAIILLMPFLSQNFYAKAAAAPDMSGLDSSQTQLLNNYLQNQNKQKEEQQKQNAQKQANGVNTNNTNFDPAQQNTNTALSKWASVLIVIYIVTLVLFLIALILSIIALSRWLRKN
ncbi:MAG: hypothetical protein M1324_01480 [Patescibacteria group bacterium]|nr:hypothetical protein [Patescibacteria group bacterium]